MEIGYDHMFRHTVYFSTPRERKAEYEYIADRIVALAMGRVRRRANESGLDMSVGERSNAWLEASTPAGPARSWRLDGGRLGNP